MDRTRVLYGTRTQTYGETNYLKNQYKKKVLDKTKSCVVLGLKPMGKLDTPRKFKYQARLNNTHGTSDDTFSSPEICLDTNSTPHGRG